MNAAAGARRAFSFPLSPALVRAAWKEYRMLRGFWLGVAALAVLEMIVVATLVHYSARPEWVFVSAWAAAALYAVGATTTLFAVEREEKTDQFLQLLPRRRRALLFGKLGTAALSSAALAAVLLVAGRLIADEWPAADLAWPMAAIGGTAIVQALAWGLLASLWIRHPLFAAVAAIAAASVATQVAVSVSMIDSGVFALEAYRVAIPACLAFAALALAMGIRMGLRWLDPRQSRSRNASPNAADGAFAAPAVGAAGSRGVSKFRGFKRLVWQTWRSDWKALAAVVPISLLLMYFEGGIVRVYLEQRPALPIATLLFIPAMCGALAFRSDQRGRQFRFLADHAAAPRQVWLARHAVWMLPVVAFAVFATVAVRQSIVFGMSNYSETLLRSNRDLPVNHVTTHYDFVVWPVLVRIEVLVWAGSLAAYGLGQLFSMLLSSAVLAGFAALVCSILVAGWCYAIFAWELRGEWLVAPIAVASMAASLAYCRSWLTERPGWRPLVAPAGLLAITLAGLAWALPAMRIAQIDDSRVAYRFQQETIADAVLRWQREEPEAQATLQRYARVMRILESGALDNAPPEPEFADERFPGAVEFGLTAIGDPAGPQETDPEWAPRYLAASQKYLDELSEISQSPHCRFYAYENGEAPHVGVLVTLGWLSKDAEQQIAAGALDRAWQRIATMRRVLLHLTQYQEEVAYANAVTQHAEIRYRQRLADWVTAPGQSGPQLVRAAEELWAAMALLPPARDMFVAEHVAMTEAPDRLRLRSYNRVQDKNRRAVGKLAYYASMLPWERTRARLALEAIANARIDYADAVAGLLDAASEPRLPATSSPRQLQALMQAALVNHATTGERRPSDIPIAHANMLSFDGIVQRKRVLENCSTAFLAAADFRTCTPEPYALSQYLAHRAWLLADVQWLALAAFRLDHGTYPRSLHELTPDYLPEGVPLDPFTFEPFQYRPDGFELPGPKAGELNSHILGIAGGDKLIPAGTPLLWSVGPGYMEPTETHQVIPPPSGPYGDAVIGGSGIVYDLRPPGPKTVVFSLTGQAAIDTAPILMTLPPAKEAADVEPRAAAEADAELIEDGALAKDNDEADGAQDADSADAGDAAGE